jgi:chaperonin GroES
MRKYKPVGDRVVVTIKAMEEKSEGGIILAPAVKEKEQMAREEGIVLAVGAMCGSEEGVEYKEGDLVAFARYGGKHLGYDENKNEIRVMREIDILVVIEEE